MTTMTYAPRHCADAAFRSPSIGARGFAVLRGFVCRLETWSERARQRRALAGLDAHQLADIGLRRDDVARELAKPFWKT
jgi:uncharacterized protein YjiS (DUF1127 family)